MALNFFRALDERLLTTLARGEFGGLRRKHLRAHLPDLSDSQLSRLLKSLRVHGLIKRVGHSYKHYLTAFGRRVVTTGLKLKQLIIIACLPQPTHA
jgi:DNA-binding HxlR family transcriptional regulator